MRRSREAWNTYCFHKSDQARKSGKSDQARKSGPTVLPKQAQISSLPQPPPHSPEVKRRRAGDRIGFLISLAVHGLLFLFAVFYVVDQQAAEESKVSVDIIQQAPQKPRLRRRAMPRILSVPPVQVKSDVKPRMIDVPTTVAQIPVRGSGFTLPSLPPPPPGEALAQGDTRTWVALDRRIIAPTHRVDTVRSPVAVNSSEPPRLEVAAETRTLASDALELRELEEISPVVALAEATRLPRFINKVVPRYPEMARRAGKEGVVILEAEIGTDGTPRNIQVVQGIGFGCDEAAIAALRASRFFPAYKGDRAVAVRIQIPYRFTFEDM